MRTTLLLVLAALVPFNAGCGIIWGCKHAEITAVSLNPCDALACGHGCHKGPPEVGIPFYLPKPLLIVSKNFRNIEEAKVGLTDSAPIPNYTDDQAKYADVNARTSWTPTHATASGQAAAGTSGSQQNPTNTGPLAGASSPKVFAGGAPVAPGAVPNDGLTPDTFFTYHIVFVPDLTQKYGLKIKGGPGELRAAMNMVNGWMFTGIGPFYMKDSSTAQNVLANGIASNLTLGGAADVVTSVQNLRGAVAGKGGGTGGGDANTITTEDVKVVNEMIVNQGFTKNSIVTLDQYAEIHIFEPYLTPDGRMEWRPVTELNFSRDFLGTVQPKVTRNSNIRTVPATIPKAEAPQGGGTGGNPNAQGGGTGGAAGPTQVNVNCGPDGACAPGCVPRKGPVLRLWDYCKPKRNIVDTRTSDVELPQEQLDRLLVPAAGAPLPGAVPGFSPTPVPVPVPGGALPVPPRGGAPLPR